MTYRAIRVDRRIRARGTFAGLFLLAAAGPVQALPERISESKSDALQRLEANAGALTHRAFRDSAYTLIRATGTRPLMADGGVGAPADRARLFLSIYGAAVGVADPATELALHRVSRDPAGRTYVHFNQVHAGLPVFGPRLIVHLDARGVTGVNGVIAGGLRRMPLTPARDAGVYTRAALVAAAKRHPHEALTVSGNRWVVYPVGLLEGRYQGPRLAYEVTVTAADRGDIRERVFIDARSGVVLHQFNEIAHVRNREVFTGNLNAVPTYVEGSTYPAGPAPTDPPLIHDPGHRGTDVSQRTTDDDPQRNLYVFAGGTYALYKNLFGREGYDACDLAGPCEEGTAPPWAPGRGNSSTIAGQVQQSVLLLNNVCPNAYWNGVATHYCPGFDTDDVVSHEWGHAYTEYTHGLIYAYQSGALNESYSDIFGETYDLVNHLEGTLGANLVEHYYYTGDEEVGSRWVIGEDLSEVAAALLLRDMWRPDDFSNTPGKATSENYRCGASDNGGVHYNSSVPNHAYAMLVDGTAGQGEGPDGNSYNHQSFAGLGMVKAAHIYFYAMNNLQTPTTDFPQHAQALRTACDALTGQPLNDVLGGISSEVITAADCAVVDQAMLATEMDLGTPCPFVPVLQNPPPALCDGATPVFSEDWETGSDGWTRTSTGENPEWNDDSRALRDWTLSTSLPGNRTGTAAFARNIPLDQPGGGTCQSGGDYSGEFTFDGPTVTIPEDVSDLRLRFDHYVATEAEFDGGQLEISVNGAAFELVPTDRYVFNAPGSFGGPPPAGNNTNPNAGDDGWNGVDINPPSGAPPGSWGTTVADLTGLVEAGDTVRLRLTFSQDGCNGIEGWYVDDLTLLSCPSLPPPELSLSTTDYESPDPDGTFTLNWTRPENATGPDLLQQSTVCGPAFTDAADEPLVNGANAVWEGSPQWSSSNDPETGSSAYYIADAAEQNESLTLAEPIAIPAGSSSTLRFTTTYGLEATYDYGYVEVSADGGATWAEIAKFNGPAGFGATPADIVSGPQSYDLSAYAGEAVLIRFRLTSDIYNEGAPAGWWVDDIEVVNSRWSDLGAPSSAITRTLTGLATGEYCFRVRTQFPGPINSPFSNVVTALVDVGPNFAPDADAGADITMEEGSVRALNGTASSDPNGNALTYTWEHVSGPAPASFTGTATPTPQVEAPQVTGNQTLTFRLTVSDGEFTASDEVRVLVQDLDAAPATAGNNRLGGGMPRAVLAVLLLALLARRRR